MEIAFSEPVRCGNPYPFSTTVTFSGEDAPDPLVLSSANPAIIGRCADNVISFALSYGFDFGKVSKVDVAGRRMIVTLENVQTPLRFQTFLAQSNPWVLCSIWSISSQLIRIIHGSRCPSCSCQILMLTHPDWQNRCLILWRMPRCPSTPHVSSFLASP